MSTKIRFKIGDDTPKSGLQVRFVPVQNGWIVRGGCQAVYFPNTESLLEALHRDLPKALGEVRALVPKE